MVQFHGAVGRLMVQFRAFIFTLICFCVCNGYPRSNFLDTILDLSNTFHRESLPFPTFEREEFFTAWLSNQRGNMAQPFSVKNMTFLRTVANSSALAARYGHLRVGFQLMSDGSREGLPYRGETLKLSEFVDRVAKQNRHASSMPPQPEPPYLRTRSASRLAQELYKELNVVRAIAHYSPLYAESYSEFINDSGELTATLLQDRVIDFPNVTAGGPREIGKKRVFTYIGERFTGSFIHKHVSACASSTGAKLWMLYTKDGMSKLRGPPDLPSHLPRKCPSVQGGCIEGIHPLDVLQHYEELHKLRLSPILHVQEKGDVFCFPDGWFHGTVNLEDVVTISWLTDTEDVPGTFENSEIDDESMRGERDAEMAVPDAVQIPVLMEQAKVHMSMREFQKAIDLYLKVLSADETSADALGSLGMSLYQSWVGQTSQDLNSSIFQDAHRALKGSLDLRTRRGEPFDPRVYFVYIQSLHRIGQRLLSFHHLSSLFSQALHNDDMDDNYLNPFLHPNFILSLLCEMVEVSLFSSAGNESPPNTLMVQIFEWVDLARSRWGFVRSFSGKIAEAKPHSEYVFSPLFMHHDAIVRLSRTNVAMCRIPIKYHY